MPDILTSRVSGVYELHMSRICHLHMGFTIAAYDMDHDEVLYFEETGKAEAAAYYAKTIQEFKAGTSGFNVEDAEDGITVAFEEDGEVIEEEAFYT